MNWLYNLALYLAIFFLEILACFNPRIRRFVKGRRHTLTELQHAISPEDRVLWVHTASLGEYEQGLPVIRQLKKSYPDYKLLVTFFSPSGYEVKKNAGEVDWVHYLPLDTPANVNAFLERVRPALAVFVKYEIWPNYYRALGKSGIPFLLISARFNRKQVFFQWYGGFMRNALRQLSQIFVQDAASEALLKSIGLEQVVISGDTRFDRVSEILERDNALSFMDAFTKEQLCLVCGSTWPEDEALLVAAINKRSHKLKYLLAPHDIRPDHIAYLRNTLSVKAQLYSGLATEGVQDAEVLIIDTIGLLTKIYSYADIAYVGGGFKTGLHNTLEPAVFGVPVLIGPDYTPFREATDLVARQGLLVVKGQEDLEAQLERLLNDPGFRERTGQINTRYVQENKGATARIMKHVQTLL